MSDMDKKFEEAAEVLSKAGFGSLGKDPPMEQVAAACDVLGTFLAGAEPMIKELVIASAVRSIRMSDFCSAERAEKIIKAAIGQVLSGRSDDEKYQTFGV